MAKILLVEDDDMLSDEIASYLAAKHHNVETCDNGSDALELINAYSYDLIVIDWGLPNVTGIEILRSFRLKGGVTPVLMLTGRDKIEEKETGFDAGADDYLTKPFDARELYARIQALLRRPTEFLGATLECSGIRLSTSEHRAYFKESILTLQPKEFQLLEFLMRHKGKAVKSKALLDHVWSSDSDVTSETLYTYIRALRKKIQDAGGHPDIIATVHSVGYTIREQD